jgi:hypothetical protein
MAAGWAACMASITRPAAQSRIKSLFDQGFQQPGDVETRLGAYLGRLAADRLRVGESQVQAQAAG